MPQSYKIIMGIDPGTLYTGYSIIKTTKKNPKLLDAGVITLRNKLSHFERIRIIIEKIQELINKYKCDDLAIESPFYGKNVQSMLKLGRAQGAIIATAQINNVKIFEYSPREVKLSVTGYGNASKQQVSKTVCQLMNISIEQKTKYDVTDAISIALCHYFKNNKVNKSSSCTSYNSWSDFIKKNPDKVF